MTTAATAIAAFIVIPAGHDTTYAAQCFAHLEARGYAFEGLFTDFQEAWEAARAGGADVVIVARPDHANPHHAPRVEVAGQNPPAPGPPRNDGHIARRRRRPNQL